MESALSSVKSSLRPVTTRVTSQTGLVTLERRDGCLMNEEAAEAQAESDKESVFARHGFIPLTNRICRSAASCRTCLSGSQDAAADGPTLHRYRISHVVNLAHPAVAAAPAPGDFAWTPPSNWPSWTRPAAAASAFWPGWPTYRRLPRLRRSLPAAALQRRRVAGADVCGSSLLDPALWPRLRGRPGPGPSRQAGRPPNANFLRQLRLLARRWRLAGTTQSRLPLTLPHP
uniref:Uncharacterized protein n=1 Tax=Macrostomum lignano TaxID=282301 RepID=A0A1I8FLT5_9PLAT